MRLLIARFDVDFINMIRSMQPLQEVLLVAQAVSWQV